MTKYLGIGTLAVTHVQCRSTSGQSNDSTALKSYPSPPYLKVKHAMIVNVMEALVSYNLELLK